jgi:hypothetical protein
VTGSTRGPALTLSDTNIYCILCCCRLLPPDELELLLASKNPPLLVLSAIGQIMAVSEMRIESKTHMDESVRVLQESLGSCEKILTTPIPISYTRHTGRFLVLWLTCLPFVIWQVRVQVQGLWCWLHGGYDVSLLNTLCAPGLCSGVSC